MINIAKQGAASAAPTFEPMGWRSDDGDGAIAAFLANGGRLMLDPFGRLDAAIDLGSVFGSRATQRMFDVYHHMYRIIRDHRSTVEQRIRSNGSPHLGWIVMEGANNG